VRKVLARKFDKILKVTVIVKVRRVCVTMYALGKSNWQSIGEKAVCMPIPRLMLAVLLSAWALVGTLQADSASRREEAETTSDLGGRSQVVPAGFSQPLREFDSTEARSNNQSLWGGCRKLLWAAVATAATGVATILAVSCRRRRSFGVEQDIGIDGQIMLGPRCGVTLVQVGSQRVLVGHNASGIQEMLLMPQAFSDLVVEPSVEHPTSLESEDQKNPPLPGQPAVESAIADGIRWEGWRRIRDTGWELK
jgi:flagellar biogenesis protein FliO